MGTVPGGAHITMAAVTLKEGAARHPSDLGNGNIPE